MGGNTCKNNWNIGRIYFTFLAGDINNITRVDEVT